ncbi:hypothetical protein SBBP2_890013 [Burkholderiales bacterium]|jgi:hypothetical protein|nr:hypothetical protein SBBP2_890013 [Burkholderiales bacterium]
MNWAHVLGAMNYGSGAEVQLNRVKGKSGLPPTDLTALYGAQEELYSREGNMSGADQRIGMTSRLTRIPRGPTETTRNSCCLKRTHLMRRPPRSIELLS